MVVQAGGKGVSLEDMAEEVLNGLFCHYEPPTAVATQRRAARDVRQYPTKDFSHWPPPPPPQPVKRSKSILKSKSGQEQEQEPLSRDTSLERKRSVTWRDHQQQKQDQGQQQQPLAEAEAEERQDSARSNGIRCGTPVVPGCDFLQRSTTAEDVDQPKTTPPEMDAPPPALEQDQGRKDGDFIEDFREKKSPKNRPGSEKPKVLYDDEGNSISDEGDYVDDRNPPTEAPEEEPPLQSSARMAPDSYSSMPPPQSKPSLLGSIYGLANGFLGTGNATKVPPASQSTESKKATPPPQPPVEHQPRDARDVPPQHRGERPQQYGYRSDDAPTYNNAPNPYYQYDSSENPYYDENVPPRGHEQQYYDHERLPPTRSSRSRSPRRHRDEGEYDRRERSRSPSSPSHRWYRKWRRPQTPYKKGDSFDNEGQEYYHSRSPSRRQSYESPRGDSRMEEEEYYSRRSPSRSQSPSRRRGYESHQRSYSPHQGMPRGEFLDHRGSSSPYPVEDRRKSSDYRAPQPMVPSQDRRRHSYDHAVRPTPKPSAVDTSQHQDRVEIDRSFVSPKVAREQVQQKLSHVTPRSSTGAPLSARQAYVQNVTYKKKLSTKSHSPRKWRVSSKGTWKHADDVSIGSLPIDHGRSPAAAVTKAKPAAKPVPPPPPPPPKPVVPRRVERVPPPPPPPPSNKATLKKEAPMLPRRVERVPQPSKSKEESIQKSESRGSDTRRGRDTRARSRGPIRIDTSHDEGDKAPANDGAPPRNRDPTPRLNAKVDTAKEPDQPVQKDPLPPTPRRIEQPVAAEQDENSLKDDESRGTRFRKAKQRIINHMSPVSAFTTATDKEIREEVSSVGMASSTIRPLVSNPFLSIPESIRDDEKDRYVDNDGNDTDMDPSTLTSVQYSEEREDVKKKASREEDGSEKSGKKKGRFFSMFRSQKKNKTVESSALTQQQQSTANS